MLSAAEFIPLAEQSDLILKVDTAIRGSAIHARMAMADIGCGPDFRIWCNVSAHQLTTADPIADLLGQLEAAGCDPLGIGVELTETAVMANLDAAAIQVERVRGVAVRVALDDFGTGHSSLALLRSMPVDELKVDRSFVAGMVTDQRDLAIVRAMTTLGREVGLVVVAEGVETLAQAALLGRLRCDRAQGFLWSPAVPLGAFLTLMQSAFPTGAGFQRADPTTGARLLTLTARSGCAQPPRRGARARARARLQDCAPGPTGRVPSVSTDDSFDLELAAASLRADASDVRILLKVLVDQLTDALGPRLHVQRAGGRFKKGDEIRSLRIDLGDDEFEAVADGNTLRCGVGPLVGGHPHPQPEGGHGDVADPPARVPPVRGGPERRSAWGARGPGHPGPVVSPNGGPMSEADQETSRKGPATGSRNSSTASSPPTCRSTSSCSSRRSGSTHWAS